MASFVLLGIVLGCKSKAADDASLATAVSTQIAADSSLTGQQIQPTVQAGVVTLDGGVLNDAQRTIAARDAAAVQGVKEVVNNLAIASSVATAPGPAPLPVERPRTNSMLPAEARTSQPSRDFAPQRPVTDQPYPPAAPVTRAPQPPPQYRTLTVAPGSTLPVRVTQTLDSATTQQGDTFSGVIVSDVVIDGVVAIPAGSAVTGNVDAVQEAAHFKGNSLLTVSLTGIRARGERIPVSTDPYTVTGKGRGKNTAEKAGGGAAVGAVLGGIFGGGKGAAIGAAAGGGAGVGVNAVTRGQQVQIPSETVVRFSTTSPITLRTRTDLPASPDGDNTLQHRP